MCSWNFNNHWIQNKQSKPFSSGEGTVALVGNLGSSAMGEIAALHILIHSLSICAYTRLTVGACHIVNSSLSLFLCVCCTDIQYVMWSLCIFGVLRVDLCDIDNPSVFRTNKLFIQFMIVRLLLLPVHRCAMFVYCHSKLHMRLCCYCHH